MTLPELRDLCARDEAVFAQLIEDPLAIAELLGLDVNTDGLKELLGLPSNLPDDDLAASLLPRLGRAHQAH